MSKNKLGRGLSSLIGDLDDIRAEVSNPQIANQVLWVPIEHLIPNPDQPRREFNAEQLAELAQSIQEHGILQPILVRKSVDNDNTYQIIAGERRWRAAQQAARHEVPVIVLEVSEKQVLEYAILENIQRADLNPMEEAVAYQKLVDLHGYTQTTLAQMLGKSRSHIANTLRLLQLDPTVQKMLSEGQITAGHARAILADDNPVNLARRVVEEGLSVRDAERAAQSRPPTRGNKQPPKRKEPDVVALEGDLAALLGMKVTIKASAAGPGKITLSYQNLDQLEGFMQLLSP